MTCFNFPSTVTSGDPSLTAVCNKHIHTGYRRSNQPWSYYVTSVFQANNQTFNIWTHLIGFLFIAEKARAIFVTSDFDFIKYNELPPLGTGLMSICVLLLGSSLAHWFCDRSHCVHYACFFLDYSCVGIYAMGTTHISHCFLVRDKNLAFFLSKWSSHVSVYLSLQLTILLCWLKFHLGMEHKAAKIIQLMTVSSFYGWLLVPLLHRYIWTSQNDDSLYFHKWHILLALFNVLVYVAHFPERWFPRTFDIVGSSHQFHHVVLVVTANSFINATLEEVKYADLTTKHMTNYMIENIGTVWMSYGVFCLTLIANGMIIVCASFKVKFEENKPSEKHTTRPLQNGKIHRDTIHF
ncbi:membrane progestin receptor gamma-like [Argopecten irradians]|uniref:membrane progestin receptor gamma-like n=1 Tax=Argopecten irradians TaxID=31199 RepID=UPI00372411FF